MKDVIKTFVQIVHILSFGGLLLCGALGVVYEIIGPAKYEQLLSSFGISNGFERTWLWAVMMLILLLSTHFIKAKLLSKYQPEAGKAPGRLHWKAWATALLPAQSPAQYKAA